MRIELSLKEKNIHLVLRDDVRSIDSEQWEDRNDLLEKFFPALDDLLTRNGVEIDDVRDFSLSLDVPQGYTTARIARTIIKTMRFAHKKECDTI